jgi:hypothetical protein
VTPDPTLSVGRGVQDSALEVGVGLFVELALVLDDGRNGLVGVQSAEFEIGVVPLIKVAVVISRPQSCGRRSVTGSAEARARGPFEQRIRMVAL